jgi:ABC-type Fe3+/spermidine/putrescine transport system ATPase subunit
MRYYTETERSGMSIRCEGVTKKLLPFCLEVDSFEVKAGTTTALLGPSGGGKSTLLNILGGLEKPDTGQVYLNDELLTTKRARTYITAVFQTPYLLRGTVMRNVAYGLRLRHVPKAEQRERVANVLRLVGLEGFEKRSVAALSGGEAQRIALARALVLEPTVLLLDEPLSSLDEKLKRYLSYEFARILDELKMTAVYVTHDRGEAKAVAHALAVMKDGRIVSYGEGENYWSGHTDEWAREFLEIKDG